MYVMANRDSLKTVAYNYIRENIIAAHFKAGQPILEQDIADKLNMSRTPVREALKELDAEGLVINYPFQGTIVASISISDVEEISELRQLLEVWALKRSFMRISDEALDAVESLFQKAEESYEWEDHQPADRALHNLIVGQSGSKWAYTIFQTIKDQLEWFRNGSVKVTDKELSRQEHLAIIHAIRERDFRKAEQTLSEHLSAVKKRFVTAYQGDLGQTAPPSTSVSP